MPSAIWPPVSLSRRTSDQPAGAVSVVAAPPRTVTWAIITSLATTPAGTGMVTRLLAAEVLPVATLRSAIVPPGPGVGVAVGTGVVVGAGVGLGVVTVPLLMNSLRTLRVICCVPAFTSPWLPQLLMLLRPQDHSIDPAANTHAPLEAW